MKWSKYQEAIFDFVENGEGNAIVEAVPGSGKTTTIIEAMNRIAFSVSDTVFLAFGKSIADELKDRGVNASTFHSLCYRPVLNYVGAKTVENNKLYKISKNIFSPKEFKLYYKAARQLVSLAKQHAYSMQDVRYYAEEMMFTYDIELSNEEASINDLISCTVRLFKVSLVSTMVDFDDLLYIAATNKTIPLPEFNFIFVDEAQDTNIIQQLIIDRCLGLEGRMVAVGDPRQAIYGFRGADVNSLDNLGEKFDCAKFPLTVCYRCGTNIVKYVNSFIPGVEPFSGAEPGEVIHKQNPIGTRDCNEGDMILCRRNAPLVTLAYRLLIAGKRPKIRGKELGENLITIIKRFDDDVRDSLGKWYEKEAKAILRNSDNEEPDFSRIDDIRDCIAALINRRVGDVEDPTKEQLITYVKDLFLGDGGRILLSTVHKAKGLEADKVIWLDHDAETPWAKLPWQKEQELNLCYVAASRAKKTLITARLA